MSDEYVGMTPLRTAKTRRLPVPHSSFLIPHLLVLLAYGLAAVIFTWPQLTDLGGQLVNGGDNRQTIWNFWLLRHSLFDLHTGRCKPISFTGRTAPPSISTPSPSTSTLLVLPITVLGGPVVAV